MNKKYNYVFESTFIGYTIVRMDVCFRRFWFIFMNSDSTARSSGGNVSVSKRETEEMNATQKGRCERSGERRSLGERVRRNWGVQRQLLMVLKPCHL